MRIVVLAGLALCSCPRARRRAGTYDVASCHAPGADGVNLAWEPAYGALGQPNPGVAGMLDVVKIVVSVGALNVQRA